MRQMFGTPADEEMQSTIIKSIPSSNKIEDARGESSILTIESNNRDDKPVSCDTSVYASHRIKRCSYTVLGER